MANWVQATPGYAFSLFLCQWPAAPALGRWLEVGSSLAAAPD
jgi:hypothetical protein